MVWYSKQKSASFQGGDDDGNLTQTTESHRTSVYLKDGRWTSFGWWYWTATFWIHVSHGLGSCGSKLPRNPLRKLRTSSSIIPVMFQPRKNTGGYANSVYFQSIQMDAHLPKSTFPIANYPRSEKKQLKQDPKMIFSENIYSIIFFD